VVKTFPENDKFLLYVTDYTTNKYLFNYEAGSREEGQTLEGDEYGYIPRSKKQWRGPLGQMTLQVTLWEPHAHFARQNVNEEDIVFLTNVHIKLNENYQRMDAAIHTDHIYQKKICVRVVGTQDNDNVKALLTRKRDFWKKAKTDSAQVAKDFEDLHDRVRDGAAQKSAKKRRKERTQQEKKGDKRKEDQGEITASLQVKRTEPNPHGRLLSQLFYIRFLDEAFLID
jgi:protection of telomeres protein 1